MLRVGSELDLREPGAFCSGENGDDPDQDDECADCAGEPRMRDDVDADLGWSS
jgi:hypothetical protein